jgi:glycosyltransferase involved in cell wall biosynthesis
VVGIGIEEPVPGDADPAWEGLRRKLESKVVLTYAGRVENGKGCDELVDFFVRYVQEQRRADVQLLLLGRRTLPLPPHPQILSPGYVSEYIKFHALEHTDIGVASSPFESMCMAALETWMHSKPMLVNGRSPVLVGHCLRSNGGLWYSNYAEFAGALDTLLMDGSLRETLGRQGKQHVQAKFRWDAVEQAYREVLGQVIGAD